MGQTNHTSKVAYGEEEYCELTRRVWSIFAPVYNIAVAPISNVRNVAANLANPQNGSRILDVATGTGKQALAFARKGFEVVGIDLSEDMLKVATKRNRYANVSFSLADATDLPFEGKSFVSCVSFALHDMPSSVRERVLKELARVTKPGGTVIIVDYALPRSKTGRALVYRFVSLYEGETYAQFIKSDLEALLRKSTVTVRKELRLLHGAARILKGEIDNEQEKRTRQSMQRKTHGWQSDGTQSHFRAS